MSPQQRAAKENADLMRLAPRVILGFAGVLMGVYLIAIGLAAVNYNPFLPDRPLLAETPAVLVAASGACLAVASAWLPFVRR